MNKVLSKIHISQSVLGILFALFIAYVAMSNFEGKPSLAYGRLFLAFILFIFSIAHLFVLRKKIETLQVFSFIPIYIFFGLSFSLYLSGYIKNWAPATEAVALKENIKGSFLLLFIFSLGVISVVFKRNKQTIQGQKLTFTAFSRTR